MASFSFSRLLSDVLWWLYLLFLPRWIIWLKLLFFLQNSYYWRFAGMHRLLLPDIWVNFLFFPSFSTFSTTRSIDIFFPFPFSTLIDFRDNFINFVFEWIFPLSWHAFFSSFFNFRVLKRNRGKTFELWHGVWFCRMIKKSRSNLINFILILR